MSVIKTAEEARELARKIASDIVLYNADKIIEGIINDNLFDLLAKEIEEGRDIFLSQVSADIPGIETMFDRVFVDIILEEGKNIKSRIWK
jgi:hypothetical protein